MKEKVKLTVLKSHPDNPRVIHDGKYKELIKSIICFYKMLEVRPPIVNKANQVIGGDKRVKALKDILKLSLKEIADIVATSKTPLSIEDVSDIINHWEQFQKERIIDIERVDYTEAEQRECMIKDNVHSGDWDFDVLANDWDVPELNDWGVGVWDMEKGKEDYSDKNKEIDVNEFEDEAILKLKFDFELYRRIVAKLKELNVSAEELLIKAVGL